MRRVCAVLAALLLALSGCDRPSDSPGTQASVAEPEAPAAALDPSPQLDAAMTGALDAYVAIQEALARDTLEGVPAACERLRAALGSAAAGPALTLTGWAANDVRAQLGAATEAAAALGGAPDLEAARERLRDLSKALIAWAKHRRPAGFDLVWCGMKQAGWIQRSGPVRNPYHGSQMLECGEKV